MTLSNPKQKGIKSLYYAGFNPDFVRDIMTSLELNDPNFLILDPWNGSGTTTAVAHELGFSSMGVDLNPATLSLAYFRLIKTKHIKKALSLLPELLECSDSSHDFLHFPWVDAPTHQWMTTLSTNLKKVKCPFTHSILFVAITRCLHQNLHPFKTSNPTWIKQVKKQKELISIDSSTFLASVSDYIKTQVNPSTTKMGVKLPTLLEGNAKDLKGIETESVDLIITSPPYCTRLDYVIATLPELYFLGFNDLQIQALRKKMIGTPCVSYEENSLPSHIETLLEKIKTHSSKASSTYYYKTYRQYFVQMQASFKAIQRVLKPNAFLHMVVQDSYYKDIPIPLSALFLESLSELGFSIEMQDPFEFEGGGFNYLQGNKQVKEVSFICQKA
jgi:DNA modification methylase